jgi:hypothetical protein
VLLEDKHMELDRGIFSTMGRVNWFSECGTVPRSDLPFKFERASDVESAISAASLPIWRDAKTEAQGDLTAYLAKHHYDAYDHWNRLSRASKEQIQMEIMPSVNERLNAMSAGSLSDMVLLDLNRIAIYSAYAIRFKRVPDFFRRLLVIYERGYLPCGWLGDVGMWPEGKLILY